MSDQKQRHPAIIRTSPKGVPDFVGRCPIKREGCTKNCGDYGCGN